MCGLMYDSTSGDREGLFKMSSCWIMGDTLGQQATTIDAKSNVVDPITPFFSLLSNKLFHFIIIDFIYATNTQA